MGLEGGQQVWRAGGGGGSRGGGGSGLARLAAHRRRLSLDAGLLSDLRRSGQELQLLRRAACSSGSGRCSVRAGGATNKSRADIKQMQLRSCAPGSAASTRSHDSQTMESAMAPQ